MTLRIAAAAHVRLILWCKECHHQVEPDPAEMADPVQTPPDDSQLDAVYSMMQKTAA